MQVAAARRFLLLSSILRACNVCCKHQTGDCKERIWFGRSGCKQIFCSKHIGNMPRLCAIPGKEAVQQFIWIKGREASNHSLTSSIRICCLSRFTISCCSRFAFSANAAIGMISSPTVLFVRTSFFCFADGVGFFSSSCI